MAQRPVYTIRTRAPYVDVYMPEFTWNSGLSVSQKQENIVALHEAHSRHFPEQNILEISSKSLQPLGVKLSAFNMKKFVPELGKPVTVECVYHGSKVFACGGPFTDLYEVTSREAKKDPRLKSCGELRGFWFNGRDFPLNPTNAFYDWLYINALLENPLLAEEVLNYDAFTDIEFNPNKSLNCQAHAAALFVALSRKELIEQCQNFDEFLKLLKC